MARTSRTALARWADAVEQRSVRLSHPAQAAAAARFDAIADPARRMALVRDLVFTRAKELTLAYRSVVMVTAGYRSIRSADGRVEIHPQPCLIFVVRRKWQEGGIGPDVQRLPERLLFHGLDAGARQLYAIPTDVQEIDRFAGGKALAASGIRMQADAEALRLPGALACVVRLSGAASGDTMVLSAMHVLSPAPAQRGPSGSAAFVAAGQTPVHTAGRAAIWGGHLDADTGEAFDVQLAHVDDPAWLTQSFAGHTLGEPPAIAGRPEFDRLAAEMRFQILAPANHAAHAHPRAPMVAQFSAMAYSELPVEYHVRYQGTAQDVLLHHAELVLLEIMDGCPVPEDGDSGSPVITWRPAGGAVFAGMLIASLGNTAYVLPSWQIFKPSNWGSLPDGVAQMHPAFSPA